MSVRPVLLQLFGSNVDFYVSQGGLNRYKTILAQTFPLECQYKVDKIYEGAFRGSILAD